MAIESLLHGLRERLSRPRATEDPRWRIVRDEPGQGYFRITTKIGDAEISRPVLAIDFFLDPWHAERAYKQACLATGTAVVAYRCGPHGQCKVLVNSGCLGTIANMTAIGPKTECIGTHPPTFRARLVETEIPPAHHFVSYLLPDGSEEGLSHSLEIKGETTKGRAIEVKVSFMPSR